MGCVRIGEGKRATIICGANEPHYRIRVHGQEILFEMHHYFGPSPLDKRTLFVRELDAYHPFWRAAAAWIKQGRRVKDGRAIWNGPLQSLAALKAEEQGLWWRD